VSAEVLVAGVGNIFLGDDGFGVEVARRLAAVPLPRGVRVADFGIRGVHLAFELLDGVRTLVLVDALARGEEPGTVWVLERDAVRTPSAPAAADAHGLDPDTVLATLAGLGGRVDRVLVVGCEPACIEERIGLSEPVARAVDTAVDAVRRLLAEIGGDDPCFDASS
jgi:hydrogenase maturation protease